MLGSYDIFSSYQQEHSNERKAAALYQADTSQRSADSCWSVMDESGLFQWLTCLADNVSADGGVKQAEYDLKAQQDMASWALGMLIVTVWLTVITLFGVFFVWRTLIATQDMARKTLLVGNAQVEASIDAVNTASESTAVATQQFRAGYRAWITIAPDGGIESEHHEAMSEGWPEFTTIYSFALEVISVGDIPAIIEEFFGLIENSGEWRYIQYPEGIFEPVQVYEVLAKSERVRMSPRSGIVASGTVSVSLRIPIHNTPEFLTRPPPTVGYIIYSDPLGNRFKHHFAFQPKVGQNSYSRFGGKGMNYEEQMDN